MNIELQTLKHGQFAERTKEFWIKEMRKDDKRVKNS